MVKKYPAVAALMAVIAGILFADFTTVSAGLFLSIALVTIIVTISLYFKSRPVATAIFALLCLGLISSYSFAFKLRTFPPGHVVHFVDDDNVYTIYGTIDDWPVVRDQRTDLVLTLDSIGYKDKRVEGRGRLVLRLGLETTRFQYGDRIYYDARLYSIKGGKNPSGFDYRRYLNLKGIFGVSYLPHFFNIQIDPVEQSNFRGIVRDVRDYITDVFYYSLDSNSAALASGFLIGETRDIPESIYNLFRDTGTLHLLAVSGSNVGLVVIIFVFLLRASPVKRGARLIILLLIIVLFSFLSYNQPSVVRASVMASLVLIGKYFQRRIELNNIIAATALIILLFDPAQLFDVGFQLSFITAWSLIFFVPRITAFVHPERYHPVLKYALFLLIASAVAQIVSLPLSAYYFQRMPMVSFVSNILIVPLVSAIVIGEVLILLVSLILPILAVFVGSFLNPLLELTTSILERLGSNNFDLIIDFRPDTVTLLIYYAFLIFLVYSVRSRPVRRGAVIFIFVAANVLSVRSLFKERDYYSFELFSIPGILAVNHLNTDHVVLGEIPERSYSVSEKIIVPFLKNRSIESFKIFVLSSDYNTINEAIDLYAEFPRSLCYVPSVGRNLATDIINLRPPGRSEDSIFFYSGNEVVYNPGKGEIVLDRGNIIYSIDSAKVLFLNSETTVENLNSTLGTEGTLALYRPSIDESNLLSLLRLSEKRSLFLICNSFEREASIILEESIEERDDRIDLFKTSQTGAVKLVVENGTIRARIY